jgi:hypothetical protein
MNHWILIVAIGSALGLSACAAQVHTLAPGKATAGRLQHVSDGSGRLELIYGGKNYAGDFVAERSRRIHGEQRRWRGHIARPVLVAPDGDVLSCDVQWPRAGKPAGTCTDKTGMRLDVRFD